MLCLNTLRFKKNAVRPILKYFSNSEKCVFRLSLSVKKPSRCQVWLFLTKLLYTVIKMLLRDYGYSL